MGRRLSNIIVRYLSLVAFFLSLGVFLSGIWLSRQATTPCDLFFDLPLALVGFVFIFFSLMGMAGAFLEIDLFLWINVIAMFFLVVILLSFNIFAFIVTNKPEGVLKGSGGNHIMFGNHCNWLKKRANKNWNKISTCLQEYKICDDKTNNGRNANFFSIKTGCCTPSNYCSNSSLGNSDCNSSSDEKRLCYECESCKAGWLDNIKLNWRSVAISNFILISLLVIVVAPTLPIP